MILAEHTRGTQPLMVTPGGPNRQEQGIAARNKLSYPPAPTKLPHSPLGRPEFPEGKYGSQDLMASCSGGEAKHREHTVTLCGESIDRHTYADQRLPWVGQTVWCGEELLPGSGASFGMVCVYVQTLQKSID